MYEDSLNPFTVFNQKQKQLRRERMDFAERIMLEMSQFFLGNKVARKFLFFYMLFLHFLLYSTVYRFTHRDRSGCKTVQSPGALQANAAAQAAGVAQNQLLVKDEHGRMRALLSAFAPLEQWPGHRPGPEITTLEGPGQLLVKE
mmetsp:Transcript_23964/g.48131  ORF Transcript_23964/g.48131 Transcript_23964/m.48131 type:complete len:144 (-) Transcript_23964:86-517(-)